MQQELQWRAGTTLVGVESVAAPNAIEVVFL